MTVSEESEFVGDCGLLGNNYRRFPTCTSGGFLVVIIEMLTMRGSRVESGPYANNDNMEVMVHLDCESIIDRSHRRAIEDVWGQSRQSWLPLERSNEI